MAADIVEFFEAFKEPEVRYNMILIVIILSIWSWSLLQFTLVLTGARKTRGGAGTTKKKKKKKKRVHRPDPAKYYIDPEAAMVEEEEDEVCCKCCPCCSTDICAITITIILQDGPFLVLRLVLIFHYKVVSYMNIFFTCKNALVTILQFYRIMVLCCGGTEEEKPKTPKHKQRPAPKAKSYPQNLEHNAQSNQRHSSVPCYGPQRPAGRVENGYDGRATRQKRSTGMLSTVGEREGVLQPHVHGSQRSLSQHSHGGSYGNIAPAKCDDGGEFLAPPPPQSRSSSFSGLDMSPNSQLAPRSHSLVPPSGLPQTRRSRSPAPSKKRSPSPRKR